MTLIVLTLYRPPGGTENKFAEVILRVKNWLEVFKDSPKILLNGDFNLAFIKAWSDLIVMKYLNLTKEERLR